MSRLRLKVAVWLALFAGFLAPALAEGTHNIIMDGNFSDWATVPSHSLSPYAEPQLQIAPSVPSGNLRVSWSSGAIGRKLLRTPSRTNPDWQFVSGSDTTNQIALAIASGNAFFRLVAP